MTQVGIQNEIILIVPCMVLGSRSYSANGILSRVPQDVAKPLADDQILAFLQSHRHDLELVRLASRCLFFRPAFMND